MRALIKTIQEIATIAGIPENDTRKAYKGIYTYRQEGVEEDWVDEYGNGDLKSALRLLPPGFGPCEQAGFLERGSSQQEKERADWAGQCSAQGCFRLASFLVPVLDSRLGDGWTAAGTSFSFHEVSMRLHSYYISVARTNITQDWGTVSFQIYGFLHFSCSVALGLHNGLISG